LQFNRNPYLEEVMTVTQTLPDEFYLYMLLLVAMPAFALSGRTVELLVEWGPLSRTLLMRRRYTTYSLNFIVAVTTLAVPLSQYGIQKIVVGMREWAAVAPTITTVTWIGVGFNIALIITMPLLALRLFLYARKQQYK
jgi:hypothetical protein